MHQWGVLETSMYGANRRLLPPYDDEVTTSISEPVLAAFVSTAAAAANGDVLAHAAQCGPLADLGCLRVAVYIADVDQDTLRMAGHSGGDEVRQLYSTLPVDESTPNATVFRTGTELFLSIEAAADQYPLLATATALYADQGDIEVGFLPLRHAGEPVGVAGLLFSTPVPRTWETRATLDAVCAVMGLWCAAHRGEIRARVTAKALTLTERQRAVLHLAAEGLTNGQIAAQLGFAESTVKADLTQLYRLTGAASRQDLLDRTRDVR